MRIPVKIDIREFQETYEQADEMYADMREIQDTVKRVCNGRRIATTSSQHIGRVPAEAELGDQVSILLGEQVPFILRKRRDHYTLVGEAYIHGIMKGEGMGGLVSSNPCLEKFSIA